MKRVRLALIIANVVHVTTCMQINVSTFDKMLVAQARAAAKSKEELDWLPFKIDMIIKSDDIEATDDLGNSRLHYEAFLTQIPAMKSLVEAGADITKKNKKGQDALTVLEEMLPSIKGAEMLKMLRQQYKALLQTLAAKNINQVYSNGYTVLHLAAKYGYIDLIKEFFSRGANPNMISSNGATPLHMAITISNKKRNSRIIQALLDGKASPDMVNNDRQTPLHLLLTLYLNDTKKDAATITEYISCINSLIDAMNSANAQDKRGNTVLHILTASSRKVNESNPLYLIIEKLLKKGTNPNLQNKDGFTPLHNAVLSSNLPLVQLLMKYGADPRMTSFKVRTQEQLRSKLPPEPDKTPLDMANLMESDAIMNQIKYALDDALKKYPAPIKQGIMNSSLQTLATPLGSLKNFF